MSTAPTSYDDLAQLLAMLPVLVRERRRYRGISLRTAAAEMGVAPSTAYRLEYGDDCTRSTCVAALEWLGRRES